MIPTSLRSSVAPRWGLVVSIILLFWTATASAETISPKSGNNSVPKIEADRIAPTVLKRIDNAFKVSVDYLTMVLFYSVASHEQEYIVFQHEEFYYREAGSEEPFRKLNPEGSYPAETITDDQLQLLVAQQKVLVNSENRATRTGTLGSQNVEYITLKLSDEENHAFYGRKYVRQGEEFRRLTRMRELLSDEDVLPMSLVEDYAAKGWLKTGEEETPWLLKEHTGGIPLVVIWLSAGAVFFTLYFGFVNIWGFKHSLEIVRGKYDDPTEDGEVTHFQALASALSATVGLGNIAGVTIAMTMGGPGAFFWMMVCGIFGMTSKFTECTLGQKYRLVKPDGTVLGGPMRYLRTGLAELNLAPLGIVLSTMFTIMCLLASFGGGNMFQANQSGKALLSTLQHHDLQKRKELDAEMKVAAEQNDAARLQELSVERRALQNEITSFESTFLKCYGLVMALLVGVVILGGIKRIGKAAEKVVPTMCLLYLVACLWIILNHVTEIPSMIGLIFTEAFTGKAMGGGFLGVLVMGVRRAAFSNEAGVGSAAIAHSAARTDEPVREGQVALLEPFIDTIVVCSMTALVILITGAWDNRVWIDAEELEGAALTTRAFRAESPFSEELFPWMLSVSVVLFAYSTIISWSYYGERSWETLFGSRSVVVYKLLAVCCVFIGAIFELGAVLDFSDMMILAMAFPNILGLFLLAPKVKRDLNDYWRRYKAGEFEVTK